MPNALDAEGGAPTDEERWSRFRVGALRPTGRYWRGVLPLTGAVNEGSIFAVALWCIAGSWVSASDPGSLVASDSCDSLSSGHGTASSKDVSWWSWSCLCSPSSQ